MLTVDRIIALYCTLVDDGGGRGKCPLHHVKRRGKCPGNMSRGMCPEGNFRFPSVELNARHRLTEKQSESDVNSRAYERYVVASARTNLAINERRCKILFFYLYK